ncbi:hypothetical protein D3C78_1432610 [compost metagenome]
MMITAAIAPVKAAAGTRELGNCGSAIRKMRAPRPAPEVTPITEGSASGLRTTPCSSVPLTASEAPARAATSRRGNLVSITM